MTLYRLSPASRLILASASPRRKELLDTLQFAYEIIPSSLDEEQVTASSPEELAKKLALLKAKLVANENSDAWILGADSIVVLKDNTVLNKPADKDEARSMLERLQGDTHLVITGIALVSEARNIEVSIASKTNVTMRELSDAEVEAYVSSKEPYDKAGGYALQGQASAFIKAIEGSHTNVIGLDVGMTVSLLLEHGVIAHG